MRVQHPRRAHTPFPTRRPRLFRLTPRAVLCLVGVVLVYLLYTALYARGPGEDQAWHTSTAASAGDAVSKRLSALPTAHSVAAIHDICTAQAPALATAPWMAGYSTLRRDTTPSAAALDELLKVQAAGPALNAFYRVAPHPLCVDRGTGLFYATRADRALYLRDAPTSLVLYPAHAHPAAWEVLDDVLPLTESTAATSADRVAAKVVPAPGVFGFGRFTSSHMWHMLRDVMQHLAWACCRYHGGALWRLPRQAVLLDEEGTRWLDREGDTPRKMAISAAMLNTFSSLPSDPATALWSVGEDSLSPGGEGHRVRHAPLLPSSLLVRLIPFVKLRDLYRSQQRQRFGRLGVLRSTSNMTLMPSDLVCFCQGLFARLWVMPLVGNLLTVDSLIQDRTAEQFGAPPYKSLTEESVWDIERQRIERYPAWARQFWLTTPGTAAYQPRVLFIHRAKRTIANVAAYVKAMRDMGFRVEEVYLERLPTAQQYYLGRYADVVVGMHGLGIGHALWMNRFPTGCRTVIEFRLWADRRVPLLLEHVLGLELKMNYVAIWPDDVVFGPSVSDPVGERERLIAAGHDGFVRPGWNDQEVSVNPQTVMAVFRDVKGHLERCLAVPVL